MPPDPSDLSDPVDPVDPVTLSPQAEPSPDNGDGGPGDGGPDRSNGDGDGSVKPYEPTIQNRFPLHLEGPVQVYALDVHSVNPGHRYEAVQIAGEWGEYIRFQEGPLPTGVLPANTSEEGVVLGTVNGWTNEAMLSLLIDRTLKLNSRNHNQENVTAVRFLSKALEAFSALEKRVRKQLPE